jgi:hypothetical protein
MRLPFHLIVAVPLLCALPFDRALANSPPYAPSDPSPWPGSTRVWPQDGTVRWYSGDPDGDPVVYDVYYGADPTPPLAGTRTSRGFSTGYPLSYGTTYYWRVVARDSHGAETQGPVWYFTTKLANEPPEAPYLPTPLVGESGLPVNPSLNWWSYDYDGNVANYDIYLGTDPDPALFADHVVQTLFMANPVPYVPAPLQPSTIYYWRVVARDNGGAETSGPVWSFTTASTPNRIPTVPWAHEPVEQTDTATPLLVWTASDPEVEPLTFDVYLGTSYPGALVGSTTDYQLQVGPLPINQRYYWHVVAKDSYWAATGPVWEFSYGNTPVLISRFDAQQSGDDVEVRWSLQSDEAMQSYTLFRRDGAGPFEAIASGTVDHNEEAYRDTLVKTGMTYDYQLLIRTTGGNEFRSPVATVALPGLALALHQNVPNPFNPQTSIRYDLPSFAHVQLAIFDVAGRRVRTLVDEVQAAASHEVLWSGSDDAGNSVSSGVYFYVLDTGKERLTRKLVLLK